VIVYESEDLLAGMLDELTHMRRWSLRKVRQTATCLEEVREGGPTVLVMSLGRNLEQELSLLAELTTTYPNVATVVVGESHHVSMAGIAWDLGARYVMLLPQPGNWLAEIVAPLMGVNDAS